MEVDLKTSSATIPPKGKENEGKVILKLSKRQYVDKIKSNKKKLKNFEHKKIALSSDMKLFTSKSLCGYYKLLWSKHKKLFLKKRLHLLGYK